MRVVLCSDEPYPVNQRVRALVEARGHTALPLGALLTGEETPWAPLAEEAALMIARGEADEGIFFCWSGTGICMAANKVAGVRAALCADPGAARAARIWNHANVLCLSNRTLSEDMAREILEAWFETEPGQQGAAGVAALDAVDRRHRARPDAS